MKEREIRVYVRNFFGIFPRSDINSSRVQPEDLIIEFWSDVTRLKSTTVDAIIILKRAVNVWNFRAFLVG